MNHKWIAVPAAAALLLSGICRITPAFADSSDGKIHQFQNALLGVSDMSSTEDLNGDGVVNGIDLCLLRQSALHTGDFTEQSYAATEEYAKLTGRTMRNRDTTWLVQSGAAVSFYVTGKSASVTLAGDSSIQNDADYRSCYAVIVDGEIIADEVMDTAEKTVTLFDAEASRTAKVQIIHLSEAMNGAIGVKNISVVSDCPTAVTPESQKKLSIEFIGDSITCAYGVEAESSYEPFRTTTENFMKSYAYLTAQKLDADYSAVSYSGHGILSGYTSDGTRNADSLIPDCYGMIGKLPDYAKNWDFSKHSYDAVVINLGTNDYSYVSKDPETRTPEFISAYIDFLKTVREKNPDAYIICTLGTMGGDLYPSVEKAVAQYQAATNDLQIMSYSSAIQNQADGMGADWHPSAITQQKSAYVLADKICQALGMESDQVGLDMAADAEYRLDIDSDKGGNAASYVGYDKSFWINMVTGGISPDAITANIAGIPLKKGGRYRLEFDNTSGYDGTLPVQICGSDGSVYFSSQYDAVSEKTHFSAEFTAEQNDTAASILFRLGGKDSYNITFSNISLVKIG